MDSEYLGYVKNCSHSTSDTGSYGRQAGNKGRKAGWRAGGRAGRRAGRQTK